jgi:shikimate kinase
MKNIVLIGMMGCGKTTVGQLLARQTGRKFLDTDEEIEAREGRSISDIFATDGEEFFRDLEEKLCRELSAPRGLVIACGGGLPLRPKAIGPLREGGVTVWLDRDPGETHDSLDTAGRPLAQAGRDAFLERYAQRAPIYRSCADHIVRADSPEEAAEAIQKLSQICS